MTTDGRRHKYEGLKLPAGSIVGFDGKKYYVLVNPKTLARLKAKNGSHTL